MKKFFALLLTVIMLLSLASCGGREEGGEGTTGPVAEEVRDAMIPVFTVTVNGVTVNQDTMAAYPVYSVQAYSVNSSGTESTVTYVGFAMKDICAAAGLTENYIWVEAAASDGYSVNLTGDVVLADTTLLAMTKNGEPFSEAPWYAPCSSETTGDYLKGCVSILVNTVEEKPEIRTQPQQEGNGELPEGLPEIADKTDKVAFRPYSFKVNGVEVTNDMLAGLKIYKISPTTVNSKGSISESTYTGYKLADVLAACGVENASKVSAVANDGYAADLNAELIASDYTLVAIEKDKETGEDGTIWLAPCSETESGAYCKLVVEIIAE